MQEIEIDEGFVSNRDITLRLNINEDVSVWLINGATYHSSKKYVSRHKKVTSDKKSGKGVQSALNPLVIVPPFQ